tara:strand:+ start:374 stop:1900 length:1527 start_codon:yes stop_codon:yes gene_type:complete
MKYISLNTLIDKYIEDSTIDFCTDESAYGFVLGLTTKDNKKIIIKLNLNYFSPYGKSGEATIRAHSKKRGSKKNQNIADLRREVSNQTEFTKLSSAIPRLIESAVLQREDAVKFSKKLEELKGNCIELPKWTAHLLSQLKELDETQKHEYETKTGVIIMESVGDLTLDDIVNEKYSDMQKAALNKHTTSGDTISETFIGKGRALLLSLLWSGILHGDAHKENIRVDSSTGKLYLIDFGASIDFGSGNKHLPKYLQKNKGTQNIFSLIHDDVNQWLTLEPPYNEIGFTKQYNKHSRNNTIDNNKLQELLEHSIIKADPRQNGELLTWGDMDDPRWNLYHEGYEWIVDIDDSSEKWKDMIHKGFHSNMPIRDISSSSNQTRRHKKKHHRKKTQKRSTSSSSIRRREEETFGEFPVDVGIEDILANYKRGELMKASRESGITIGRKDTKNAIIEKIIKTTNNNSRLSSGLLNSLRSNSSSKSNTRRNNSNTSSGRPITRSLSRRTRSSGIY